MPFWMKPKIPRNVNEATKWTMKIAKKGEKGIPLGEINSVLNGVTSLKQEVKNKIPSWGYVVRAYGSFKSSQSALPWSAYLADRIAKDPGLNLKSIL